MLRIDSIFFAVCWAFTGIAYLAYDRLPDTSKPVAAMLTAVFVACSFGEIVGYDVAAFLKGAYSTISQVVLNTQQLVPMTVPILVAICAVLSTHFTIPHVHGEPFEWRSIARWCAIYAVEFALISPLGATIFAQRPNQD